MKTLELRNGDLVIGAGGFSMVSGVRKVYQDLSVLVREEFGADRFHPRWGGILHEYVGRQATEEFFMLVKGEIQRLIQNYMVMQARQVEADTTAGRRPRYSPEEIVVDVDGIEVQQRHDRINVKVNVVTASGEVVNILRTVGF